MNNLAMFFLGALSCFLIISTIVGISYSSAVLLGKGIGMCSGVLLDSKIFMKNRAAKSGAQPTRATNTGMDVIAEMSKSVKCLALELPESVWNDINKRWNAVLAQLHHA